MMAGKYTSVVFSFFTIVILRSRSDTIVKVELKHYQKNGWYCLSIKMFVV